MVPYVVGGVFAVTMMHVLLFVYDVSMLREYEGDSNAGVGDGGSVSAVNTGHEYVGGTRVSDIVSSASAVLGMRGVGGACEMCMILARDGGEEGEWVRGLGFGFTNPMESGGVFDMYLYLVCGGVDGVGGERVVL